MTALEIFLIITGLIIFGGSFFITEKITATREQLQAAIDVNEVKSMLEGQLRNMSGTIEEAAAEAVDASAADIKRAMEKLSNEKIMAITEYSDSVLDSISKNHNEVMFLYGMLNDKNKEIRETAELITKANKSMNKKIGEGQAVIDKMDAQIEQMNSRVEEMNSFTVTQKESVDKLADSAKTVALLEEQLNNIEEMAIQFSKDLREAERRYTEEKEAARAAMQRKAAEIEKAAKAEQAEGAEEEADAELSGEMTEPEELVSGFAAEFLKEEEEDKLEQIEEEELEMLIGNAASPKEEEADQENNNDKILKMSKSGSSALEIAKTLGLGVGEVQLVIDLFKGGR